MNDEYNDNDFVDPEMKKFVENHPFLCVLGTIALIFGGPSLILYFMFT